VEETPKIIDEAGEFQVGDADEVSDPVHQFARGRHALCGKEIVFGVVGTTMRADVTCEECLSVRDEIEMGYKLFRMHPQEGDVVVIRLGPKETLTKEMVDNSLLLTEKVRAAYPEVTFMFMWDEQKLEEVSEMDMAQCGWQRRGKPKKIKQSKGNKFRFKNKLTGR
jgi:hypothetical protein